MSAADATAAGAAGGLIVLGGLALAGWVLSAVDRRSRRHEVPPPLPTASVGYDHLPPPPPPTPPASNGRNGLVYRCTVPGCPLHGTIREEPHAHRRRTDGRYDAVGMNGRPL